VAKAKPATRLVKAGRGHSYLLDGEACPGVTTILDRGVPKPGLIGWASSTVADFVVNRLNVARNDKGEVRIVADDLVRDALDWNSTREGWKRVQVSNDPLPRLGLAEILKNIRYRDSGEAAARGTEVHGFAARLANGEAVLVPKHLEGHVLAYVRFLEEWQPANAIVEQTGVNRSWKYMGTFDLLADFPGVWTDGPWSGKPIGTGLLDVKTARSGVFADNALQLVGYKEFETIIVDRDTGEEEPMPEVDWVGVLHVRADGYSVHPMLIDENTFRTFLYIKQVGDWLDRDNGAAATVVADAVSPPTI
jgi:hypothetical protein